MNQRRATSCISMTPTIKEIRSSCSDETVHACTSEKLTKRDWVSGLEKVNLLRRFSALLLLAVWLTATQHCALEAAGLGGSETEKGSNCCAQGHACSYDGCETVERGSAPSLTSVVKVPTPNLDFCVCVLYVHVVAPIVTEDSFGKFTVSTERSPDWGPPWQFTRRAAQSPRAPSLIVA